jgi:hypothetical protein
MYKLLVEQVAESRKARRDLSNVFMTMNLAGVGALGTLAGRNGVAFAPLLIWVCGALILTCVIWRVSNSYYTRLLAAKFEVIYKIEGDFEVQPMREEYEAIGDLKKMAIWFSIERTMPYLFILGYAVFAAYVYRESLGPAYEWSRAWIEELTAR